MSEDTQVDPWVEELMSRFDEPVDTIDDKISEKEEKETSDTVADTEKTENKEVELEEETKDKVIPFHKHPRFKQLVNIKNEYKAKQEDWRKEKQDLLEKLNKYENRNLTEEELENMSKEEVLEYGRQKALKEKEFENKLNDWDKQNFDKEIDNFLQDLKDSWEEVDENKLLKLAVDYTEGDLDKAFILYKDMDNIIIKKKEVKEKEQVKKKEAESNTSWKWWESNNNWFISWTSWRDLKLQ